MAPKFIYFNKEGEPKMVARVKNEDNVRVAGRGCACGCALPPSSHLHSETAYTPSRQENKDRNLCVCVWCVCARVSLALYVYVSLALALSGPLPQANHLPLVPAVRVPEVGRVKKVWLKRDEKIS